MRGKELLAKLLGTTAAPAAAVAVAAGAPGLSAEQQSAGTTELEGIAEKAYEEGRKAGIIEGRTAERERMGSVLTSEDAVGRTGLAITLLSTTDNTPEQIASALKASPAAAAQAAPAVPAAEARPGQRQAGDPLAGEDTIARDTPLVDTGAPQPPVDGPDEKAVVDLWKGALSGARGGVTEGGVWGGLTGPAN
jgi:hypothetical protein